MKHTGMLISLTQQSIRRASQPGRAVSDLRSHAADLADFRRSTIPARIASNCSSILLMAEVVLFFFHAVQSLEAYLGASVVLSGGDLFQRQSRGFTDPRFRSAD